MRIYTDAAPNKFRFSIGRLPRARGAADAFRADCRIHRPGHGLQRRRRRRAPVGTSRVVDVLPAPRDQARDRPAVCGRRRTARQPARRDRQPRVLARRLAAHADVWARRSGWMARITSSSGFSRRWWARWNSNWTFWSRLRWEPPRRKGPFFLTVLGRLRPQSGHDTRPQSSAASTGGSFRSGRRRTRTPKRHGP